MAHIHLINIAEPASDDGKVWKFPYALPILVSGLKDTEHTYEILDTHLHGVKYAELFEHIKNSKATIFGISAWSHNYALYKELAAYIKTNKPGAWVIAGGIISSSYGVLLNNTMTDIVATGAEGENVLPDVLDALDSKEPWNKLKSVCDIAYKDRDSGGIVKTPKKDLMTQADFQELSMPAYADFDKEMLEIISNINSKTNHPVKGFPLLTMRGCPFPCTFCWHMFGKKFLRKSWDKFFDEVEFLVGRYGLEGIFSYDSNMFLKKEEAMEYAEIYNKRGFTFKSCIELRTTFGDKEMFEALFNAGVRVVLFGYESGSQYMLDRMKKGFKLHRMKDIIQAAADSNLVIDGNFIFGTPGENVDTVNETYEFMLWLDRVAYEQKKRMEKLGLTSTSRYVHSILTPTPGSELYTLAIEKKLITDEDKYLMHLSDDKLKERAIGSTFKIKLFFEGGDVNMSEFSSKRAMIYYVDYVMAKAALIKYGYSYRGIERTKMLVSAGIKVAFSYSKYIARLLSDFMSGQKGYFDRVETEKYRQSSAKKIQSSNLRREQLAG